MSDSSAPLDLYLAYYADAESARLDYEGLKDLADGDVIKLEAIVLVTRTADGKIEVEDEEHTGRKGAGWGAAAGLVVGALFPPSLLAGAAAGALVGGGAGSLISRKNRNDIKADLETRMPPDSSAVVAAFEEVFVKQVEESLSRAAHVQKEELDDSSETAVKDANS